LAKLQLDRFKKFDEEHGQIHVELGNLLEDIAEIKNNKKEKPKQ